MLFMKYIIKVCMHIGDFLKILHFIYFCILYISYPTVEGVYTCNTQVHSENKHFTVYMYLKIIQFLQFEFLIYYTKYCQTSSMLVLFLYMDETP